MRGQGYDGASNMASNRVGVQARIRQEAPLAVYVHCNGHCLNLVINKSCSLPQVRNVVDRLLQCCRFFLYPKRMGTLELIVKNNVVDSTRRKAILVFVKHVGLSVIMLINIFTNLMFSLLKLLK